MQKLLAWAIALFSIVWLSVAVLAVGIIGRAVALKILWGWFVVPEFGLQPLSLALAAGLTTMTYVLLPNKSAKSSGNKDDEDDESSKESLTRTLRTSAQSMVFEALVPIIAVTLGWVFKMVLIG